jgi:hypothetical protein
MAIKPDYQAGTVSITNGATALTGVGTLWAAADIQPGDTFKVANLDAIILAINSNTSITLKEPWTGGTLSGSAYAIRYQPDGSRYSAALRDLVALLGNGNLAAFAALAGELDLIPIFTGAGALTVIPKNDLIKGVQTDAKVANLAARTAYDASPAGFSVLVSNVGDGRSAIYFKNTATSGDWSPAAYLTGPNGTFQSKGTYSGATAYVIGDVVLQNGSSWIARVNTTGNPPPTLPTTSNTQWFLLSAAGNGFVFKGAYSGATAYVKDDVVLFNNSTWIALQSTTGNAPPALPTTSNTWWSRLAAKGVGDVSGPATNADGNLALWNGVNSKTLKDGGPITAAGLAMANIAGSPAANKLPYLTAANAAALADLTAFARTILDDTTGAAMAATMGYVQSSVGSSWYVKLPGGVIIQWGSTIATTSGGGGGVSIALAQSYTTSASWSLAAMNGEQASGAILLGGYPAGKTASGFLLVLKNSTTGAPQADGVAYRIDWVAVGV